MSVLRDLAEYQKPKKLTSEFIHDGKNAGCPSCECHVSLRFIKEEMLLDMEYCPFCGQLIDWED